VKRFTILVKFRQLSQANYAECAAVGAVLFSLDTLEVPWQPNPGIAAPRPASQAQQGRAKFAGRAQPL